MTGAGPWLPRSVVSVASTEKLVPLAFTIPGGSARLLRWLVAPAQPYDEGHALARIRLAGGAVWDLAARTPGTLEQILVADGSQVTSGEWLALSRP